MLCIECKQGCKDVNKYFKSITKNNSIGFTRHAIFFIKMYKCNQSLSARYHICAKNIFLSAENVDIPLELVAMVI